KRTSSGLRFQFSVENAYAERYGTPISMHPCTTSMSTASPCLWPSVRARPRSCAHRPLPSMTSATCRGTNSAGISGGVAPDGCGVGGLTVGAAAPLRGSVRLRNLGRPGTGLLWSVGWAGLAAVDEGEAAQVAFEVPLQV